MKVLGRIAATFFLLGTPLLFQAQCAMCKAMVESEVNAGVMTPDGINDGILYLMAVPYILVGSAAYVIYRYNKNLSKAETA